MVKPQEPPQTIPMIPHERRGELMFVSDGDATDQGRKAGIEAGLRAKGEAGKAQGCV